MSTKSHVKTSFLSGIPILVKIWEQERFFRLLMGAMIHILVFLLGFETVALLGLGCLFLTETLIYRFVRQYAHFPEASLEFLAILVINTFVMSFNFTYPTLFLVSSDISVIQIAGLMWILGIIVYASQHNSYIPIIYWVNFSISMSMLFVSIGILASDKGANIFGVEGGFLWLVVIAFAMNAIKVMLRTRNIIGELQIARSEAKARLKEVEKLHCLDQMTGLFNRKAYEERLEAFLSDEDSDKSKCLIYLIDLNKFKPINDSFGHAAGDEILLAISRRFLNEIKDPSFAARLGGDEFVIVRFGALNDEDAVEFGYGLLDLVKEPVFFEDRALSVGCSIGIVRTDQNEQTVDAIGAAADRAMYTAKLSPTSSCRLFEPSMMPAKHKLTDRFEIEKAIRSGKIRPFYQPKVDLRTGKVVGMEALARWDHIERGVLSPAFFLPQIEDLGLQADFTYSIARQVLNDVSHLLQAGLDPGQVSINIAEASLATDHGRQDLLWLLSEHKETAPYITLEVTEDVVLARSSEYIRDTIIQLVQLGVRVSLDDFGTGYASFQHLRDLSFDELKIDTSFVAGLGREEPAAVIIKGFLAIAEGLGTDVVAEGVETPFQRDFLLEQGCNYAQGYLYSRPVQFSEIVDILKVGRIIADKSALSTAV